MASIIETVAGDRRIELMNEEMVRSFSFGSRWTQLTVGVRFMVNGVVTIPSAQSPEFIIGLCAGNKAYKGTVTDMIGVICCPRGNMIFDAGPPAYYSAQTTNTVFVTKTGSTRTATAVTTGAANNYVSATPATPHMFAATFTHSPAGSGITAERIIRPVSIAEVQAGCNFDEFIRNIENETGSNPATIKATGGAVGAFTLTTVNVFDSAFVYWSHNYPSAEISDWIVVRHY